MAFKNSALINILFLIIVIITLSTKSAIAQTYELFSPDNQLKVTVRATDKLTWSVEYKGETVVEESEIAMTIDDHEVLGANPKVSKKSETQKDDTIIPAIAQKSAKIRDFYKQLSLAFKGKYGVEFRAYNDGVAYRFTTSFKDDVIVQSETAQLNLPENTTGLFPLEESLISHYERLYVPTKLDTISEGTFCSLPVLMKVNNNVNVLFTEADLFDYPGMFLYGTNSSALKAGFSKHVLKASPAAGAEDRNEVIEETAEYVAKTSGTRTFPWRVCIISDNDGALVESQLVYQLSRPSKIENTEWIKPGKVAWDWYNANNVYGVDFLAGINNETYKYYIDFAAEYGLEYIILDEGWSKSTTEILEPNPEINVPELVEYGKKKDVGIILWSLWKPIDQNLEEVMKTYREWGVKGVKIDFMQRADQYMVNFYEKTAAEAADNQLLVDYHGAFKPSGLRRTYPNVITYEGVKGNENNKWSSDITPEHNVTLPFARMVAGPMDYTPGAMANAQKINHRDIFLRPMSMGTRCHQVAMYVVYESPLQMLCDAPSAYYKEKETTEFISKIPVVWDETKVLDASVADYIVIARRNGDQWYIGAMTDWTPREMEIDFSFLPEGTYDIEIMQDGLNAHQYAEDYKKLSKTVDQSSKMKIKMAPGGGWAAIVSRK